jgi:hypothetical protein
MLTANSWVSAGTAIRVAGQPPDAVLVQGEDRDAAGDRHHQVGLRPVDGVAGGQLFAARPQEVLLLRLGVGGGGQDREDGADRQVDVDVAGAVQRIEGHQHAADAAGGLEGVQLLRGEGGDGRAGLERVRQDVVGDQVELLLLFVLHVDGPGDTEDAGQGGGGDGGLDADAGVGHGLHGGGDLRVGVLRGEIGGQGGLGHRRVPDVGCEFSRCRRD